MEELAQLQDLLEWLRQHKVVLWSMAGFSVAVIISSMVVIPWMIIRIPDDYFIRHLRPVPLITAGHPVLALLLTLIKKRIGSGAYRGRGDHAHSARTGNPDYYSRFVADQFPGEKSACP